VWGGKATCTRGCSSRGQVLTVSGKNHAKGTEITWEGVPKGPGGGNTEGANCEGGKVDSAGGGTSDD